MKDVAEHLLQVLKSCGNLLIVVKGSPDPDAIASSFAVKIICDHLGVRASIIFLERLSLSQNSLFVRRLKIPFRMIQGSFNAEKYDAYAVLDHQSAALEGILNPPRCALHIDHHEKTGAEPAADFRLIRNDVGSTSTMMTLLMKEMNIALKPAADSALATALLYGIQTDTDKYQHATNLDYEALALLSSRADRSFINRISRLPMSEKTAAYLALASRNRVVHKDWLMAGIGFISESDRDSIAIIADHLLKKEKAALVAVYAAILRKSEPRLVLDASLRTNFGNVDLNGIIKGITASGGARSYKGAFQIDLNYLNHCQDRGALWKVINLATIEAIRQQRDRKPALALKSLLGKISRSVSRLFR